ncbi:MAG TPA: plastocyanin/azurin family copper-binding protein [Nitrososphaera sp.]|nr:plastocyanin/azurin family copper-binding protein [Nitrososphaera sp.]
MTDWDLLTPGIGLTSIGIVGVGISLSGIAKTFLDGMNAVTLLTMFFGMIFLASGLFKDGFPSTGRAKSATFITLGFLVTFGVAAAVTVSVQVPSIYAYIGVMSMIGVPGAVLAVTSYRKPQYVKAMGVIFILGAAVGGITFYAFGLVTPKIQQPAPEEKPAAPAVPQPTNIVKASVLPGASAQGNPSYGPNPLVVAKGDGVEWTNKDNVPHTVTSKADSGKSFNSNVISPNKTFLLNTATLKEGDYEYYCTLHPFMDGMLKVGAAGASSAGANATSSATGNATSSGANATSTAGANATSGSNVTTTTTTAPANTGTNNATTTTAGSSAAGATVTDVSIVVGASTPTNGQFFSPPDVKTTVGSMVTWTNHDNTFHTVTSGKVVDNKPEPDKVFDSGILKVGASFPFVFEKAGEYDYYCSLHPYMTGKVTVS